MKHFYNQPSSGSNSYSKIIGAMLLFCCMAFSQLVSGNTYSPTTFSDPDYTTINNTTGVMSGGTGNGLISLRSAIIAADNLGGTHTITLSAGTYAVTRGEITFGSRAENITFDGISVTPLTTVIDMQGVAAVTRDRIFFINYPSATTASVVTTLNNIKFSHGNLFSDAYGGGAIRAGGPSNILNINGCVFDSNTMDLANGGGTTGGAINFSGGGALNIDNSTFTNNVNKESDGGAVYYFFANNAGLTGSLSITNSTFSNNSGTGPNPGGSNGGAIGISTQGSLGGRTFSASILKNTFINNSTANNGGAIHVNNGDATYSITISYNRIVGNTSGSATTGGLAQASASGNVNAANNWWGCNTDPTSAGACNRAAIVGSGGSGTLTTNPWLQLKTTASPSQICTNTTSTFTSSFLTNSAGTAISVSNLDRVIGLPISFVNPVLGTLSGAQTTIQASGTATVTYTSGTVGGNGSVNAVVDNIPSNDGVPAKALIFVSKPVVTNPATASGTVNVAFTQSFTGSAGVTPYTFTTASALPANLTLSSAGVLSGTPVVVGTYPIVVNVADNIGCTGTSPTYNLVLVCQVIPVTNPATTTGTVGTAFSQAFTSSNTIGTIAYTLNSGTLPTGFSLSSGGVLSGTTTQFGTFPLTIKVTDANGCTGISATYNLVINCQTITVTNPGVTTGTNGTAFSQTFTQSGALSGATFTTASTLPTGLTLSTAGVLSGTPSAPAGTYPIVVTVTDGNGCTGVGSTYNLVIGCQSMSVTNPVTTTGTVGTAFSQTFTQTGGIGTVTFTTASPLPAGLALSAGGVLSGTPTSSGNFAIVVKATDANGCNVSGLTYNLVINSISVTTDYFRTRQSGNWNSTTTWESASDATFTTNLNSPATLTPDLNANTITILNTHTVTITADLTTDQTVVNSGGAIIVNPNIVLTINNGTGTDITVASGGSLTLKSTATGTAMIGNSAGTITGNVIVERFISAASARAAWRLLTAPLRSTTTNATIFNTWQNGGVNTAGKGTLVTGPAYNGTNGLDASSFRPSMQWYDGTTLQPVVTTNTAATTPLFTTAASAANNSYFIFIRGDRNTAIGSAGTTTLSATGALQTGDQIFTATPTADAYTMIGNPYASPVDLSLVRANNLTASSNVKTTYYYWDPYLTGSYGVGGYVTVSYDAGGAETIIPAGADHTKYLQSGQAMFVQTNNTAAASLIFKEAQKSTTNVNNIFRTTGSAEKLEVNLNVLSSGTPVLVDGIVASFDKNYSASVDQYDAAKLYNVGEGIAFMRENKALSIERRPLPKVDDVLYLNLASLKSGTGYQFEFAPDFIAPTFNAYLKDNYLNTTTPIDVNANSKINFTITGDAASTGANRFSIVFSKPAVVVSSGNSSITVYPNPVTNGNITLQFSNMAQGNYMVRVLNDLGQTVLNKQINHAAGSTTETIQLGKGVKGVYHVEVIKPDASKFSTKIIAY